MNISFQDMMKNLPNLSVDELGQLNRSLITILRAKQTISRQTVATSAIVSGKFQPGDVVKFFKTGRGRNAGWNYFRFDHMNRNGDCMQGPSCNPDGTVQIPAIKWTVGLTSPMMEVAFRNGQPFNAK